MVANNMSQKDANTPRIAQLRDLLGLSQSDFSESIGITQGALSHLETGKSSLSFESIRKISHVFDVNCNWLIGEDAPIFKSKKQNTSHMKPYTRDSHALVFAEGLIPLVKEEVHAGYIENCDDDEYLTTLDVYKIPGYEHGDYRLFEVAGDSMVPSIHPRETLVAEFISDWSAIENGALTIVVSKDGIVAKRFYTHEDKSVAILKSDNASYKTYSLPISEIREVWQIRAKITNVFAQDPMFATDFNADQLKAMQDDIASLKDQMKSLHDDK